jgi:hypothetical protein
MNSTTMASGWLADVVQAYGKPRLRVDDPAPMRGEGGGRYERRCWVWFPANTNHHISIDHYGTSTVTRTWVVRIGAHRPDMPQVEWSTRDEPDDALMRMLLAATGFLAAPVQRTAVPT